MGISTDLEEMWAVVPINTISNYTLMGPSGHWESCWCTLPNTLWLASGDQYTQTVYIPGGPYDGSQSASCYIQPPFLDGGQLTGMLLWQDVAVEEHGTDAVYRSTTMRNQFYHDQGTMWNTMIPQQPANAGYMQQGGSPAASIITAPLGLTSTPSMSTQALMVSPCEPTPGSFPGLWTLTQNQVVSQPIQTVRFL